MRVRPLCLTSPSRRRHTSPAEAFELRVLELLVEQVTYNAEEAEVAITFRPGGVRLLATDKTNSGRGSRFFTMSV